MSPVLSVQNLSKSYGGRPVVDDVSLVVLPGGICGFLGPNGAGKTTFMNMVTGLVPQDKGTITLLGQRDGQVSRATRSRIGFLQEKPCIYPDMTLGAYLQFFAGLYGIDHAAERCRHVTKLVGLTGHTNRALGKFSRGMQQRACLARVLLHQPEFLILDEPTLGLDPIGVIEMREIFLGLREQGVTILFSSHQLAEMERICDHIILMYEGRIAAAGPRKAILGHAGSGLRFMVETFESAVTVLDRLRSRQDDAGMSATGECSLLISVPDAAAREGLREARARISARLTAAGVTVLSIEPDVKSLEDLFVRLAGLGARVLEANPAMTAEVS